MNLDIDEITYIILQLLVETDIIGINLYQFVLVQRTTILKYLYGVDSVLLPGSKRRDNDIAL